VIKSSPNSTKALVLSESDLLCYFELLRLDCFLLSHSFLRSILVTKARDINCVVVLAGKFCSRLIWEEKAHSVRGTVWEREGVEKDPTFVASSTGSRFARTEPRYNKFACHTLYLLVICFAPSLTDLIIFLTLTRLMVVINFVNFSFALFTPL
jgi:hypothetical protein